MCAMSLSRIAFAPSATLRIRSSARAKTV
jgi:hypothetical protein